MAQTTLGVNVDKGEYCGTQATRYPYSEPSMVETLARLEACVLEGRTPSAQKGNE
jgi:hypothetical protein